MPEEQLQIESAEFDWRDKHYVVLRPNGGLAIYTNVDGDIVIRQQSLASREQDDAIVFVPKAFVRDLISGLEKELAA